jgi:methionine-rich copper-binding protein CopC
MRLSPLFRAAAPAFAFLAFIALTASARAHAVIVDSVPSIGATLPPGDADIRLHYNSRIDHQRSRLTLVPAEGASRPLPILPDSAPDMLAALVSGLAPGQYRLRWQVLAIDGHLTRGDIPFTVKAP